MQFLYDNQIDDAVLTASSTKDGYSVESLKDYHLSRNFLFNLNAGNIVIDLGSAKTINDFIVGTTNLTSGATLTLEANSSDSWSSPAFSTALTRYINGYIGVQELDETYQYWRLVVEDTSLTNVSLGYIFIGSHLQLPGIDPGISLSYNVSTKVTMSPTRQSYADTGVQHFSSGFKFPIITDEPYSIDGKTLATREDILEFWYINQGARPFILVTFEKDNRRVPPMMGLIVNNSLTFSFDSQQAYYSMDFSFEETK